MKVTKSIRRPYFPSRLVLCFLALLTVLPIVITISVWRMVNPSPISGAYAIGIAMDQVERDNSVATAYGVRAAMDYYSLRKDSDGRSTGVVVPPRLFNLNWPEGRKNPKDRTTNLPVTVAEVKAALDDMTSDNGLPPAFVTESTTARPPITPILGVWTTNQTYLLYEALKGYPTGKKGEWTIQFILENVTLSKEARLAMINELKEMDSGDVSPLIFTGAYNEGQASLALDWVKRAGEIRRENSPSQNPDEPLLDATVILPDQFREGGPSYAEDVRNQLNRLSISRGNIKLTELSWASGLSAIENSTQRIFILIAPPDNAEKENFIQKVNSADPTKVQSNFLIFSDSWHTQAWIQEFSKVRYSKMPTLAVLSSLREASPLSNSPSNSWSGLPTGRSLGTVMLNTDIATRARRASWAHLFGKPAESRFAYGWDLYVSCVKLQQTPNWGSVQERKDKRSRRTLESLLSGFDLDRNFNTQEGSESDLWRYGEAGVGSWILEFPQVKN